MLAEGQPEWQCRRRFHRPRSLHGESRGRQAVGDKVEVEREAQGVERPAELEVSFRASHRWRSDERPSQVPPCPVRLHLVSVCGASPSAARPEFDGGLHGRVEIERLRIAGNGQPPLVRRAVGVARPLRVQVEIEGLHRRHRAVRRKTPGRAGHVEVGKGQPRFGEMRGEGHGVDWNRLAARDDGDIRDGDRRRREPEDRPRRPLRRGRPRRQSRPCCRRSRPGPRRCVHGRRSFGQRDPDPIHRERVHVHLSGEQLHRVE